MLAFHHPLQLTKRYNVFVVNDIISDLGRKTIINQKEI
ncbi:hypothetical protein SMQ301_0624 [Streptococcus thermophilus]|nr:hypothetical protein SMQ301_0624 [Streptococcus thermophilus]